MQLWESFTHTGLIGKGVLVLLLLFSITSWGVMIIVGLRFSAAFNASKVFIATFRKSRRLIDVQGATDHAPYSPLVGLFRAGYAEIEAQMAMQQTEGNALKLKSLEAVERALQRASQVELTRLSRNMPFLATAASATPFIGLFGTVVGIMGAFAAIGTSGSASITAVAPGISEALINTAAGLFAAIPALIGYNHYLQSLRRARGEMEDFALEFLNMTERNFR